MSQKILIPTDAVICIIGSTCTGKSTLSKELLERVAPQPAVLISGDAVFEEQFGVAPDLLLIDLAQTNRLNELEAISQGYSEVLKAKIVEGLERPGLLIYEFAPNNVQEVISFIMAATLVRDTTPFILIKMDLDKCLARKFRERRRKQGRCFPESAIRETQSIHKPIVEYKYNNLYSWVTEYVVRDPRRVELEVEQE